MTHLEILDLIAGLIFIYFLLSIICNSVFEIISGILSIRSKLLEEWLKKTFKDEASHFLNNSLVDGLSKDNKASSYMKANDFAVALVQLIGKQSKSESADVKIPVSLTEIKEALTSGGNNTIPADVKNALLALLAKAKTTKTTAESETEKEDERFHVFISYVENWFDNMMERLTGKYKRKSMIGTFVVASLVTLAVNVDTISISKYLYSNKEVTAKLAQEAYDDIEKGTHKEEVLAIVKGAADTSDVGDNDMGDSTALDAIAKEAGKVKADYSILSSYIPLGWKREEFTVFKKSSNGNGWDKLFFLLTKIAGLLFTIFAVMLGAPFWYDVLGKVANLRNTLKPSSQDENKQKENTK